MEDLQLSSVFFLELFFGAIFVLFVAVRLRLLHNCRVAADNSLPPLQGKDLPLFYSSYYLKQECQRNFFRFTASDAAKLAGFAAENPALAAPKVLNALRQAPENYRLLLLYAELCLLLNDRRSFKHAIEQIKMPVFAPAALKAGYWRLYALNELYNTDMLSASAYASKALKIYQKCGFAWEEGECYLTLAQIYRISGVFDVAFTMLKQAEKIFAELRVNAKIAEAKAYLGLLELGRENYVPALEYLAAAENVCIAHNLNKTRADIRNWQGLVFFLKGDNAAAQQRFRAALEASNAAPETMAFAAEMLARLNLRKKDYSNALKNADNALALHQKSGHRPDIFENLYLKAEIYYAQNQYGQSAEILTALVKEKFPAHTTFYPANAYTLLGLINLKQNRLNAATTLFKQAVDLENSQNRLKGAAIDYNNLAEISYLKGYENEATAYLNQALAYAETLEDEELKAYLKARLKPEKL